MADVAFFFHWPLAELEAMPPEELMEWRERAVSVHNRLNTPTE